MDVWLVAYIERINIQGVFSGRIYITNDMHQELMMVSADIIIPIISSEGEEQIFDANFNLLQ